MAQPGENVPEEGGNAPDLLHDVALMPLANVACALLATAAAAAYLAFTELPRAGRAYRP